MMPSVPLRVVRQGAISLERLREVVPGVLGVGEEPAAVEPPATPEQTAATPDSGTDGIIPDSSGAPAVDDSPRN